MKTVIKQAFVVNEGNISIEDILISNQRIEKIAESISLNKEEQFNEIDATGLYLLPGMIDDQVHFRDPGLTHKATIYSESRAAVAGGITSFMDMPNTIPNTLTLELLEDKYQRASESSLANYSFFMGINKDNLEETLKVDNEWVSGITDDGLYFNDSKGILANYPDFLEKLFSRSSSLIALHSENETIINQQTNLYKEIYGEDIPIKFHAKIRNEEACFTTTKQIIEIAEKTRARLHVFHVSTKKEANLFNHQIKIRDKRITAEACVHHLWFTENDYEELGGLIKWNPSIKTLQDKEGLWDALITGKLDIIATDHAPHTLDEKQGNYFQVHSGGPLVQHALLMLLDQVYRGRINLTQLVEKIAHNPSEIYRIVDRGYIREGYFADLVLINPKQKTKITNDSLFYKCKWSPLLNHEFNFSIEKTFVNGICVFDKGKFQESIKGMRIQFEKER